jgi:uncharacterized protein involved in type VI secretion and phage assembly
MIQHADHPLHPAGNPPALGPAWAGGGVFLAVVTDLRDPAQLGRVQVVPQATQGVAGQDIALWASVVSGFAGAQRGAWWIPDVGDLVVIAFVQGDARLPLVLGGVWHGQATPPEAMDGNGDNHLKVIRSRNGVKITMDDLRGQERIRLETPGGQSLTLQDGPARCTVTDSNGNTVTLEARGITIDASAKVTVNAASVEVNAASVQVNAAMSQFSGVVRCDTLISNTVISAAYTPGAGNIW